MLGHPLPAVQGAGTGCPHRAHADGGDARGSHDTCHASWAHAGRAAGSGVGQELAAEGLPCTHLWQGEMGITARQWQLAAPWLCCGRALTVPYWLSSWLCFSCSAATVAVAVAVAVAAAAATAAAAAAWVKSVGGRPACEGSPIPLGPPGLPVKLENRETGKGRAVALWREARQGGRRGDGLTWRQSLSHQDSCSGHRRPVARSPSRSLPQQRAAAAGTAASSSLNQCWPSRAAAGCWSCSPQDPWGCRKPGGAWRWRG